MPKPPIEHRFSRRERQAMDAVYRLREATVADVMDRVPDPASYNAVRSTLAILVEKGFLRHRREGLRFVYSPALAATTAKRSALRHLVQTFFGGSPRDAILSMIDDASSRLTDEELDEISASIRALRESEANSA